MVVNFTLAEGESEPQRILSLVEERIDEPIAECVVDYHSIRASDEDGGDRSALVAVARRDVVISYLELLRRAGLRVDALEIVPVAIHRLAAWLGREERSSHTVLLHGGKRRSHLIVYAGRRLLLYRELEFGEDAAVEALGKALEMGAEEAAALLHRYGVWPDEEGREAVPDPAEAVEVAETLRQILKPGAYGLAEEIERAGVYTASQWRGASIDRVWLLGAFARWPRVERLVESLVSVPTSVLDPTTVLARAGEAPPPGDGIALAAGLALRGLVDE
jgi:Tfp pilus assembly PilM family ATPase